MAPTLVALAPVFMLIVLGYLLKTFKVAPDAFWAPAEWMTFYLFFPCLLLRNITNARLEGADVLPLAAASLGAVLAMAVLVRAIRSRLPVDGPGYTSVFQGSMRPNVYLGIAVVVSLFGDTGVALLSVCIAVLVPTVNMLGVIVLVRHAGRHGAAPGWRQTVGPVARNPLILACLADGALNLGGISLPAAVDPFLEILGRASLPLALLAVGAGLNLSATRRGAGMVTLTSLLKVAVLPALTFAACALLGVDGLGRTVAVLFAALPGSGSAYVLARQMGGDAVLLAGSITATTIAAVAVLPAVVLLMTAL